METALFVPQSASLMNPSTKKLKENMKLDFNSAENGKRRAERINKLILSSPDVQRLVLESPEMERILNLSNFSGLSAAAAGGGSGAPSDNAVIYNTKDVSEDQEAFVLGFMSALKRVKNADINKTQMLTELVPPMAPLAAPAAPLPAVSYSYAQHAGLTSSGVITHSSSLAKPPPPPPSLALPNSASPRLKLSPAPAPPAKQFLRKELHIKEEPSGGAAVAAAAAAAAANHSDGDIRVSVDPLSGPIDMECQERFKLDRKRARNRVAAQKCRTRKIERIHMLQQQSDALKCENQGHQKTFTSLQRDIASLKNQIMLHNKGGCKVTL